MFKIQLCRDSLITMTNLTPLAILVVFTRAYYQLEAGLKSRVNDIFIVLCWALVNSVPEVSVRDGPLDLTRMAAALVDPELGSTTTLPEQMSCWDLLSLRVRAQQLLALLARL